MRAGAAARGEAEQARLASLSTELGELEAKLVNVANVACGAGLALGMVGGILGQEAPAVVSLCVAGLATGAAEKTRDMQQEFKTSVKRRGDPIPKLW